MEAASIADRNKIIGNSITPGFLAYMQLQVHDKAAYYGKSMWIMPSTDYASAAISNRMSGSGVLDAELVKRLAAAKGEASAQPEK